MTKPIKVYDLFPTSHGWSPNTIDNDGIQYSVAAVSIKQAYFFGGNRVWADFGSGRPLGILQIYNRARDAYELACGCSVRFGLSIGHKSGVRTIRAAIDHHLKSCAAPDASPEPSRSGRRHVAPTATGHDQIPRLGATESLGLGAARSGDRRGDASCSRHIGPSAPLTRAAGTRNRACSPTHLIRSQRGR